MKPSLILSLLTLLLGVGTSRAEVRLALDETSILPGTPTGLTVIVSNPGKTPLQLPPALWLVATTEDVTTFRVSAYDVSDNAAVAIPAEERIVQPGGTREYRFDPSNVLAGSPWFTDGRLSAPGTYRLRAVLAPTVAADGTFNAAHALASDEQLLTIAVESPDDVAVWDWMRARGHGKWGQAEWLLQPFADFVMQNYPRSSYALYAVIFLPARFHAEKDQLLLEQARRFPRKAYSDQLKLHVAHGHRQAADTLRRTNPQAAGAEADAARQLAAEVASTSRSSSLRAAATELLATIPAREAFVRGEAH